MAILLFVSAASSEFTLNFTLTNDSDTPVLISQDHFEIDSIQVCNSSEITNSVHCRRLENIFEEKLAEHFKEKGKSAWVSFKRTKVIEVNQEQSSFAISLSELANNPLFYELPHCFKITITITTNDQNVPSIEQTVELTWYPFKINRTIQKGDSYKDRKLPIIQNTPVPPKANEDRKQIMLEYRDTKPFYLNVAEPNTLRLWITGNEQNSLIDHVGSSFKLTITPHIEFLETDINADLRQDLTQKFNFSQIKLTKRENATLMILPIENPKGNISQDSPATLKVTLGSSVTCEIPTLLQRPAFPGHIALDFGTTNSAIAYYDPSVGIPEFPDRQFSNSQLDRLNRAIHQLMDEIERQTLKDKRYQGAAQQLVHFAKMMWTTDPQGNQVQSISDIKQHFVRLQHRDVDKKQIGGWQAKLLVSWGIIGYNTLKMNHAPLAVLNFVAQHYFNTLNQIIDIDLKEDAKLGLPELDPGQRNGTIPSDILMQDLKQYLQEASYPKVDGLCSKIDMGEAVKINLPTQIINTLPDLPEDGKERHNLYLSGAKRGLGLKETSYFVDRENQAFLDTYDPLCTAAVKELFTRTETDVSNRRYCLNNAVVTYPANLPQYRREGYRKMMQSLGVAHLDMSFDEATAGALYYVWRELFKDLFAGIDGFLARSRVRRVQSKHPVTNEFREVTSYYQNILLYDLGGGTTDIALLEISLEEIEGLLPSKQRNCGRYFIIRPKILGLTGREDFGGDNITLAVFRILKSKLASVTAQLLSEKLKIEGRRNEYPKSVQEALDAFEFAQPKTDIFTEWFAEAGDKKYDKSVIISQSENGNTKTETLPILIEALVTTRFESKPELQPLFFSMWQEAERIKKTLSTPQEGYEEIPLPEVVTASPQRLLPAIAHLNLDVSEMELGTISVTLQEMERLVQKEIAQTFEKARNLCIDGNKNEGYTTKYLIDRLVLAGSGSHLRLVREEIPHQILSKSFNFEKGSKSYPLSAPFKLDGYNLNFTPNDAKLAVVRGACLPRYFQTTRVPPESPKMPDLLTDGVNFLDFDVDNLRNYMPFTLIYAVGNASDILFESGAQMRETSKTGQAAIRKSIPTGDIINCYRIDNVTQIDNTANQQYYAQFHIRDFFIQFWETQEKGEKLLKDRDKEKLDNLMSRYLFWMEFDIERDMKCFMYTKPMKEGNDDDRYVNQTATVIEQERLFEAVQALIDCQEEKWTFKSDVVLWCPAGVNNGPDAVQLKTISPTQVEGKVRGFSKTKENKGGITRFALSTDSAPLWQIDLQGYHFNNCQGGDGLLQPELHIQLELKDEQIHFTYTVYDPDLTGEHVREIEMSHDSRKAKPPFNPYRGEE